MWTWATDVACHSLLCSYQFSGTELCMLLCCFSEGTSTSTLRERAAPNTCGREFKNRLSHIIRQWKFQSYFLRAEPVVFKSTLCCYDVTKMSVNKIFVPVPEGPQTQKQGIKTLHVDQQQTTNQDEEALVVAF